MTKEEHLQKQCNLLYNTIMNMKGIIAQNTREGWVRELNDLERVASLKFDELDKEYEGSSK